MLQQQVAWARNSYVYLLLLASYVVEPLNVLPHLHGGRVKMRENNEVLPVAAQMITKYLCATTMIWCPKIRSTQKVQPT